MDSGGGGWRCRWAVEGGGLHRYMWPLGVATRHAASHPCNYTHHSHTHAHTYTTHMHTHIPHTCTHMHHSLCMSQIEPVDVVAVGVVAGTYFLISVTGNDKSLAEYLDHDWGGWEGNETMHVHVCHTFCRMESA